MKKTDKKKTQTFLTFSDIVRITLKFYQILKWTNVTLEMCFFASDCD